jgi:VCBS repeat protein
MEVDMGRAGRGWLLVAWAATVVTVGAGGCASLPDLAAGVCGNGVVDPATEDCDTIAAAGATCGAPGSGAGACRYLCDPQTRAGCPAGWGCGGDGMCRLGDGTFGEHRQWHIAAENFAIGDVDGDGAVDLVGYASDGVEALFNDGHGEFGTPFASSVIGRSGPLVGADLDGDGRMDVTVPVKTGIFELLGQPGQVMAPVPYAPFSLPAAGSYLFIPMEVADYTDPQGAGNVGQELLIFADFIMTFDVSTPTSAVALPGGHRVPDMVGRVPVGDIDRNGKDELALAFTGETTVWIYDVVRASDTVLTPTLKQAVTLPAGARVDRGARFADVDSDGALDLMVSVSVLGVEHVVVAHNDGAGNLGAAAVDARFDAIDGSALRPCPAGSPWPIAAGNLHRESGATPKVRLDYVGHCGVWITLADGQTLLPTYINPGDPWTEAAIADFNRDGSADVAAVSDLGVEVTFLLGNGTGLFNTFRTLTDDPPSTLRVGDFDGDFVLDLAVVQHGEVNGRPQSLAILYGNLQGAPGPSVFQAQLGFVTSMETAFLAHDFSLLDLTSDLVVGTASYPDKAKQAVAAMLGSSERTMLSPFTLAVNPDPDVVAAAVGKFDGDDLADVITVSPPNAYLLHGSGDGQLTKSSAFLALPAIDKFSSRCAIWAVGPLDGSGRDSVVAMDGAVSRTCPAVAGVAPAAPRAMVLSNVAGGLMVSPPVTVAEPYRNPTQLQLVDVDGDGLRDLLVVYGGPGSTAATQGVVVYWNLGGGRLVFDGSQAAASSRVPAASCGAGCTAAPFSAAALNTDDDPALELAILADTGVYLAKLGAGRQLSLATAPAVKPFARNRFIPGEIFAADVNNDGVTDLVINQPPDVHAVIAGVRGKSPGAP